MIDLIDHEPHPMYSMCMNYTLKHYLMLLANNRSEPSNIHCMDSDPVLAGLELDRLITIGISVTYSPEIFKIQQMQQTGFSLQLA